MLRRSDHADDPLAPDVHLTVDAGPHLAGVDVGFLLGHRRHPPGVLGHLPVHRTPRGTQQPVDLRVVELHPSDHHATAVFTCRSGFPTVARTHNRCRSDATSRTDTPPSHVEDGARSRQTETMYLVTPDVETSLHYDPAVPMVSIIMDSDPTGASLGWSLGFTLDDDGFYTVVCGPTCGNEWFATVLLQGTLPRTSTSTSTTLACR